MLRPRDRRTNGEPEKAGREADRDRDKEGIFALVRQTADGIGQLIADHIKLARVEIVSDAKVWGRGAAVMAIGIGFVALGYALGMIAGALALSRLWGGPLAFLAVAGLNLLAGGIGLGVALSRIRQVRLMRETTDEVNRSVAALTEVASSS
jgi:putative superfamily III holin-X